METNTQNDVLLSWSAPERLPVDRGAVWYAVMGGLVIGSGIWSILSAAWTLTIVIILGSAMYYQVIRNRIEIKTISISKLGLQIGEKFSAWDHCTGFWIYRHGEHVVMHVEKDRGWEREIVVVIDGLDYQNVAEVMSNFLPYRSAQREKVIDYIIRVCKL